MAQHREHHSITRRSLISLTLRPFQFRGCRIQVEDLRRINFPLFHRGCELLMISPGRDKAAAAIARHHPDLRQHLLTAMIYRKPLPEVKAADCAQLLNIVKYAATHPGDA